MVIEFSCKSKITTMGGLLQMEPALIFQTLKKLLSDSNISKYMCIFALVIMRTEGDAAASCVVWLCLRMFMTMIYDL